MRRSKRVAEGIIRDRYGFRAYVKVGGEQVEQRFLPDTPLLEMKTWREEQRVELRKTHPAAGSRPGTFGADVSRYLRLVEQMPSYRSRKIEVEAWLPLFKARTRRSIKPQEVEQQMADWLAAGLSPSTVRHRRTALVQVYKKLDRPGAPNPAALVAPPPDRPPEARGIDWALAHEIVEAMADVTKAKAGEKRTAGGLTRLRVRVLLETGIPPKQIAAITPADFDAEKRALLVRGRKKGKGTAPRVLPLTKAGADAVAALLAGGAAGPFSTSSMRKSFLSACRVVNEQRAAQGLPLADLDGLRPYDLRHSWAMRIFDRTGGNIKTVSELLLHQGGVRMAERYARKAVPAHLERAIALIDDAPTAGTPAGSRGPDDTQHADSTDTRP